VLHITDEMRDRIRDGASPEEILKLGRKQDLILMKEDGILKAMLGKTTFEEVFRLVD
jgi:type II secretory ATPase GspE/PulE/Tfp pilus assembly ATPase PilB-like protein